MVQDNYRKIKLLKLLEMLQLDTDEQHPMTTNRICARLDEMGIICDRRTLSKDIALLNEQGYEVMDTTVGHEKGYYVEDRSFSIPELKILMDAVQAASFITEKKTAELLDKIAVLSGSHRAEILKGNIVNFKTTKHSNEQIFYNVRAFRRDSIIAILASSYPSNCQALREMQTTSSPLDSIRCLISCNKEDFPAPQLPYNPIVKGVRVEFLAKLTIVSAYGE